MFCSLCKMPISKEDKLAEKYYKFGPFKQWSMCKTCEQKEFPPAKDIFRSGISKALYMDIESKENAP